MGCVRYPVTTRREGGRERQEEKGEGGRNFTYPSVLCGRVIADPWMTCRRAASICWCISMLKRKDGGL